jgi:hypothetical protein
MVARSERLLVTTQPLPRDLLGGSASKSRYRIATTPLPISLYVLLWLIVITECRTVSDKTAE